MKTLTKFTRKSCFLELKNQIFEMISVNFGNGLIFANLMKPILFPKHLDQILNHFYHYLIPSVTEGKINLFNKI